MPSIALQQLRSVCSGVGLGLGLPWPPAVLEKVNSGIEIVDGSRGQIELRWAGSVPPDVSTKLGSAMRASTDRGPARAMIRCVHLYYLYGTYLKGS